MSMDGARAVAQATREVSDQMQRLGWYRRGVLTHERPTPWSINNGWCDDWADAFMRLVGGGEAVCLDDRAGDPRAADGEGCNHMVVLFGGRFYDAETPTGVSRIADIPMVVTARLARLGGSDD